MWCLHRVWHAAARLVMLVLALQFTGALHVLSDATLRAADDAHEDGQCEDGPGKQCPPLCPACHCIHQGGAMPMPCTGPEVPPSPALQIAFIPSQRGRLYESPFFPGLYRPPRSGLVALS